MARARSKQPITKLFVVVCANGRAAIDGLFVVYVVVKEQGATNVDLQLAGDRWRCRVNCFEIGRQQTLLLKVQSDRLCQFICRVSHVQTLSEKLRAERAVLAPGRVCLTRKNGALMLV